MEAIRKRGIVDVGASSSANACNSNKIPKIHEAEADQLSSDQMFYPDKDPKKIKELIANRNSATKFRLQKAQYVAELEEQAKTLESYIGYLRSLVEAYKDERFSLQVEQLSMKSELERQKDRIIIEEGEIEKKKEEVKKQWEILSTQLNVLREMTNMVVLLNSHANMRTTSSTSNAIPSTVLQAPVVSTNFIPDLNADVMLD